MDGLDARLLDERVALQLVHHWLDFHIVGKVEETACLEVRNTDGTNLSCAISLFHGSPRAKHVAVGLMDEQQVDIIGLQPAQAFVNTLGGFFFAGIRNPHFCHEEQVLALQSTLAPGIAHALFVLISLGCVYQAITHTQRIAYATFTLVRAHQKHSVAQGWHFNAIIQFNGFHHLQLFNNQVLSTTSLLSFFQSALRDHRC